MRGSGLSTVAIVSVTYNRCGPLLVLLSQLRRLDYPSERLQVFLVDNASTDDTVDRVRNDFPEVNLTVSEENLGTSAGFNVGMRKALEDGRGFDFIWLLDSDAEVEGRTLGPLVSSMEANPRLGIVGSAIYDPSARERLVTAGLRVDWRKGSVHLNKTPRSGEELVETDFVPACSLLVRNKLCEEVGLWDERFWIYWGDTDWCVKAARHGYRVCSHMGSRAWHRDWANTKRNFRAPSVIYDDLRGGLLFHVRHAPGGSLKGVRRLLLKSYAKAALERFTARPHFSVAVDDAVADFLRGRFEVRSYEPAEGIPPNVAIEEICRRLSTELTPKPTVLLNQLETEGLRERVVGAFQSHFPEAKFREILPQRRRVRSDFTTDYLQILLFELPQLFWRLLGRRQDVIVSEIGSPHIYTLAAARRGVFLDPQALGVLRKHELLDGLLRFGSTLLRGLRVAYWDLSRASRIDEYRR
jgi:hypothetical protein